jgi:hypothetical protein
LNAARRQKFYQQEHGKHMYIEEENALMDTDSQQKKDSRPLTQAELMAWWPFTRLDPKRFPKQPRRNKHAMPEGIGDAPL